MRLFSCLTLIGALVWGLPNEGRAAIIEFDGTLLFVPAIHLDDPPPNIGLGTGVATLNGSGGGAHINTLEFDGGLTASTVIPLTDPELVTLVSLVGTHHLPTISAADNQLEAAGGAMALPGIYKLCFFLSGCVAPFTIPLTINGTAGAGLGGLVTVNTFATITAFKVSVEGAPWTLGLASVTGVDVMTPNGMIMTTTPVMSGFAHGPASASSTTGLVSGVLQAVTPVKISTSPLNPPDEVQAAWGVLTLRVTNVIPEPAQGLLLGSGAAALVWLGRRRVRR